MQATEPQESTQEISVLIADDESDLLYVLRDALDKSPFRVTTAEDGECALDLLRSQHFDIVITDLVMPGADGTEVLRLARSLPGEVLVVIITGHASVETAVEAVRQGAYDYIRKPFRVDELELVMANAAERIRLSRENRLLAERLEAAYGELAARPAEATGFRVYTSPEAALAGSRPQAGEGLLEALERVARLRNENILSQEEFELCKKSLLRRL